MGGLSPTMEKNADGRRRWHAGDCNLDQLRRLAGIVALDLQSGDFIRLEGGLGAGKTTFATALLRAYGDDPGLTVPSPTFTLVERYDFPRGVIHHADLYRLQRGNETDELGLDDAISDGIVLIEWPDRAPHVCGEQHMTISLELGGAENTRNISLLATSGWHDRLERMAALAAFTDSHIEAGDRIAYLQGDASVRRYGVIHGQGGRRILMDSPAQPDGPPVEDDKSYSRIAHLAENLMPFVAVGTELGEAGLCVPAVHACNLDDGFAIIEHLGARGYGDEIANGANLRELYAGACDVLLHLRGFPVPDTITLPEGIEYHVPEFDYPAFAIETRLFTDWYIPAMSGTKLPDPLQAEFDGIWRGLYEKIRGHDNWVIRDFHSPNLIHRPDESGLAAVGVIDFQDALRGHAAYDLVSLLQDARLDVPEPAEADLLQRYCERAAAAGAFDETGFRAAYAILGAQRNTKILGIFTRLARRDGKPQYLAHIPRIWGYLERNLRHDGLTGLRSWYIANVPEALRQIS